MIFKYISFALLTSLSLQVLTPEVVYAGNSEATDWVECAASMDFSVPEDQADGETLQLSAPAQISEVVDTATATALDTISAGICMATADTVATFLPATAPEMDAVEDTELAIPPEGATDASANADASVSEEILPAALTITTILNVPEYSGFKSFEDYSRFKSTSAQKYLQDLAVTDENGLRVVDGRYTIAIGSAAGAHVGQYLDLVLENGTVIECVMGDLKDDRDTDAQNLITVYSNCCSEFIVETKALSKEVRYNGNLSKLREEWNSRVVQIIVYDASVTGFETIA